MLLEHAKVLAVLGQDSLLLGNLRVELFAVVRLEVVELSSSLQLLLTLLQPLLSFGIAVAGSLDGVVSLVHRLHRIFPLRKKILTLVMQLPIVFSGFVKFHLRSASRCHLLLHLLVLALDKSGQLFNLEVQLANLCIVCLCVSLDNKRVVFLLLPGKVPLLELLLVEVHRGLELVHPKVALEDAVLHSIELLLQQRLLLLKSGEVLAKSSTLSLGELAHVIFGFDLSPLGLVESLGVDDFGLDVAKMIVHELEPIGMLIGFALRLVNLLLEVCNLRRQLLVGLAQQMLRQHVCAKLNRVHFSSFYFSVLHGGRKKQASTDSTELSGGNTRQDSIKIGIGEV